MSDRGPGDSHGGTMKNLLGTSLLCAALIVALPALAAPPAAQPTAETAADRPSAARHHVRPALGLDAGRRVERRRPGAARSRLAHPAARRDWRRPGRRRRAGV